MQTSQKIKIFDYVDYRLFLRDRFLELKNEKSFFSYRYLAKKIGYSGTYLKYIFDQKKSITLDKVIQTANAFKLNNEEKQFLIFKVLRQSLKEADIQNFIDIILFNIHEKAKLLSDGLASRLGTEVGLLDKNWLYSAIATMTDFEDFQQDPQWIKKRFLDDSQISLTDIQMALEDLQKLGVIEKKNEKLQPSEASLVIRSIPTIDNLKFFRDMAKWLLNYCENPSFYEPQASSVIIASINRNDFEKIKELTRTYSSEIAKIATESKNADLLMAIYGVSFTIAANK